MALASRAGIFCAYSCELPDLFNLIYVELDVDRRFALCYNLIRQLSK